MEKQIAFENVVIALCQHSGGVAFKEIDPPSQFQKRAGKFRYSELARPLFCCQNAIFSFWDMTNLTIFGLFEPYCLC